MGSVLVFLPGLGEIRAMTERLKGNRQFRTDSRINNNQQQSFEIIPMHSTLSSQDQKRAFLPSRNGTRKIILSTNIAETSVTIPDVVCVIDTGRVREVRRNKRTLTSVLETVWCSKASAKQRAGRAGRVQPGLCIKLYSSQTEQFVMKAASEPELRRVPLEEICLSILAGGFAKSSMSFLSKAPQPPDEGSVQAAVETLQDIGAIQVTYNGNLQSSQTRVETLTPLGRHLAKLPVDVRLAKMLIFGALFRCLDKALTIAASLSCKSPFVTTLVSNDAAVVNAKHSAFASGDSDFETYCNVWQAYNEALRKEGSSRARKFCQANYLSLQVMREINDARRQYLDLLCGIGLVDRNKVAEDNWTTSMYNEYGNHDGMLNAVFCAGLYPNIAHMVPTKGGNDYVLHHKMERLHFHHSSVNARKTKKHATESYLCFHEKFGTGQNRVSVSTTCSVHPYALILFGGNIDVKHAERRVAVDGWIELSMAAQIGVMLKEFRKQVDSGLLTQLLMMERQSSSSDTTSSTAKNEKEKARKMTNIMVQGIADLLSSPSGGITKGTFHATSRLSGGTN
jgi:HrpA-like RNA helicase